MLTTALSYRGHLTAIPPSSIGTAAQLLLTQPRAAAGAIPSINGHSLSRGTSKHPPQAQKALPISVRWAVYTEVIAVCIIGLAYREDAQISLVTLPLSQPRWKLWNSKKTTEGKSCLPALILPGWVQRAKASALTPGTADRT